MVCIFAHAFKKAATASAARLEAAARKGMFADAWQPKPQTPYKRMETTSMAASLEMARESYINSKEVLTSDEAAKYLGVTKSCLYKWTMTRKIPHYKSPTGKVNYFNRKEIEAWMQSIRVATAEELSSQAQRLSMKGRA